MVFDLWWVIVVGYVFFYVCIGVIEMLCGFCYVMIDKDNQLVLVDVVMCVVWWVDGLGILLGNGIVLCGGMDCSDDFMFVSFDCLCQLWSGEFVMVQVVWVSVVVIVIWLLCVDLLFWVLYGVSDGLLFMVFIFEFYVAWLCSEGCVLLYWCVLYVQYFDVFFIVFVFGVVYVLLMFYGYIVLD